MSSEQSGQREQPYTPDELMALGVELMGLPPEDRAELLAVALGKVAAPDLVVTVRRLRSAYAHAAGTDGISVGDLIMPILAYLDGGRTEPPSNLNGAQVAIEGLRGAYLAELTQQNGS